MSNRAIAGNSTRRPAGAFFHWNTPGEPIAVYFQLNLIDALEGNAVRAGNSGTAGVLLGRREDGRLPMLILEDSESLPVSASRSDCGSPFGNRDAWESVVGHWQAGSEKRISILGFYRSGIFGEKSLNVHDLAILEANSTGSEQIFLLIEPHAEKPTSGFLFMARDGVEAWKWSEIPFSRGELAGQKTTAAGSSFPWEASSIAPQFTPIEKGPEARPAAGKQLPGSSGLRWVPGASTGIVAIFVAIISLIGGQLIRTFSNRFQMADESALGLKAQRSGIDLQVSWDRRSPVLGNATAGRLSITDGNVHKTVDLDLDELRNGSISYLPMSDDVTLRLDVTNRQSAKVASESVRVIAGFSPEFQDQGGASMSSLRHRPSSALPPTSDHKRASESSASNGDAPDIATRVKTRIATSIGTPTVRNISEQAEREGYDSTSDPDIGLKDISVPPLLVSSASELNAETSLSSSQLPVPRPATVISEREGRMEPAHLILGKDPQYPLMARQVGIEGNVKITFRVGSDGNVKSVNKVDGPAPLKEAVIQAVKAQRYNPAQINGTPAESEVSLIYVFKLN